MSEFDRLKARLKRTATDGRILADRQDYETPVEGVARLLDEIDGTVIGRRLKVDFADGSRLSALVTGRRLVRLDGQAPAGLPADQAALYGREGLATEDAAEVAGLLAGLCGRGPSYLLSKSAPGEAIDPTQAGVSAAAIAAALGLEEREAPADDGRNLEVFLDALGERVIAAALIEQDEIALIRCDEETPEAAFLLDWAAQVGERLLTPDFALYATLETGGLLVFAGARGSDRHLAVAGRHGRFLLAALEGADSAATLDCWRHVTLADSPSAAID